MKLELWYSGGPVSIQQAYSLVLQTDCCTWSQYMVFSHLSRYGYRIKRRTDADAAKKKQTAEIQIDHPPPCKKLRIDPIPNDSINPNRSEQHVIFKLSAPEPWLLNLIPNLDGREKVNLECDPILVPESCRNSRQHDALLPKFQSLRQDNEAITRSNENRTKFQQKARNWIEFKKMPMQGVDRSCHSDNPLIGGNSKPLVMNENFKLG